MNAEPDGLLVKVRNDGGFGLASAISALPQAEVIRESRASSDVRLGATATGQTTWLRTQNDDRHPWDQAHAVVAGGMGAAASAISAEPDMLVSWAAMSPAPGASHQNGGGGRAVGPHFGWHLDTQFSGLRDARAAVSAQDQNRVLIAHLDTGYDPAHRSIPAHMETARERNFTGEGAANSARDVTPANPLPITNRGHGTATLALLAGGDPGPQPGRAPGPLGGAPQCRVLPIRVGDSVVQLRTSTIVQGFDYARMQNADVISMSMGGITSDALAEAVNDCYEAGVVIVTAAGNFVEGVPSPRSIVYPARHRRVIAATGVMANGAPYDDLAAATMAGCHGPDSNMAYALAGWTPNTFWARFGAPNILDEDGQGTSAATPQVAAAAALWIAAHNQVLAAYPQRWMRGEAVRQALFRSARLVTATSDAALVRKKLGRGALDALRALAQAPLPFTQLVKAPVADASRYMINLLIGVGSGIADTVAGTRTRMFALEMAQIAQRDASVDAWLREHDEGAFDIADRKELLALVRDSGLASDTLRAKLGVALDGRDGRSAGPRFVGAGSKPTQPTPAPKPGFEPPVPTRRRLQIFALDPSLGVSLATFESKMVTVDVRFEPLKPGPIGEYLEVIDVDPASDRFYPPVDLDHPSLLICDGLAPSEGLPQFHQQMVYAVAMRTIASFEDALGRPAIWASHKIGEGRGVKIVPTPRLRIYPHALRARNAYYSPEKVALLFGYFPSVAALGSATAEGTLVYSALSADIVAHETTHALLDGYTPGYREMSNPDVGAFHEAFADVVALLQHFQYGDLVKREMIAARGELGAATLLGGLAKQFGEGSGNRGALRDYLSTKPDFSYRDTLEVHDRGSILVRTIYLVLLSLFERRAADLIALATDGSGVLRAGAIRPELADRLAREATRIARDMLRMCIRAIDYCPPVDITFGSFLRALITADSEVVASERLSYRTAFLEQFRAADLLPTNLKTASVETLRWSSPPADQASPAWLGSAVAGFNIHWREKLSRETISERASQRSKVLHDVLSRAIAADPSLCIPLGLEPELALYDRKTGATRRSAEGTAFEVRNVRAARRPRSDGTIQEDIIAVIVQRKPVFIDGSFVFMFHGGCTLVIDPGHALDPQRPARIRYAVYKRLTSQDRLDNEIAYRTGSFASAAKALYFDDQWNHGEPFAALHADRGEAE